MDHIALPLKRFLIVAVCPPDWRAFDLYLFRDDEVVFYVGQSHLAYDRVWQHIADGYKAFKYRMDEQDFLRRLAS